MSRFKMVPIEPASKMPQTKIGAFFLEFPWLRSYVAQEEVNQVHVKRVDTGLLTQYPESITREEDHGYWDWDAEYDVWKEIIVDVTYVADTYLLDASGEELVCVGKGDIVRPAGTVLPARAKITGKCCFGLLTVTKHEARPQRILPERRAWDRTRSPTSERIEQAVERLSNMEGKKDKGSYILSVFRAKRIVTVYKTPKGHDLVSWIRAELQREQEALRKEFADIDGVQTEAKLKG